MRRAEHAIRKIIGDQSFVVIGKHQRIEPFKRGNNEPQKLFLRFLAYGFVPLPVHTHHLLMPRDEVRRAWQRRMGPERLRLSGLRVRWPPLATTAGLRRGCIRLDRREEEDDAIELLVKPLADEFQVSPQAMRIRLERLGWVVRDLESAESLFGAA